MNQSCNLQNQRRKYKRPVSTSPDNKEYLKKVLNEKLEFTHKRVSITPSSP